MAASPSRWRRATGGDLEALRELAGSFWYGVYAWWRRTGLPAEQAGSATVACFAEWMTEAPPHGNHTGSARMRAWLCARLAELAVRGVELQGAPTITIDPEWAEELYQTEPEGEAEAIFLRRWALTILEFTMGALQAEYAARGQESLFTELSPFAFSEAGASDGTATPTELSAFRQRHGELLRAFVKDTVAESRDIENEAAILLAECGLPVGVPVARPAAMEANSGAINTVIMTNSSSTSGGLWRPPGDAEVASLFPQYEMHGILGRGGMGAVYKARQVTLDRFVAIKLLPMEISTDRDFADRFVREARAMAKLNHPNIIDVYDFGSTSEGHLYFVMEFVEGANLADLIHAPTGGLVAGLSPDQALAIIGQVCTALAYAHSKGIIHRDIKPANVMVDLEGTAKVADFGLARLTDPDAEQFGRTMTGMVMGTPAYMAPEQKRGMDVDHRADIFSLGVMFYEMLCQDTPHGIFEPPSQRAGCDARLDQIVIRAMTRDPEKRYQSTTEMRMDLEAARDSQTLAPSGPTQIVQPRPAAKAALANSAEANAIVRSTSAKKSKLLLSGAIGVVMATVIAGALLFTRSKSKTAAPAVAKDVPFTNTLGMKFLPVPITGGPTNGQRVLFSIWETRGHDYEVFAQETKRPSRKLDRDLSIPSPAGAVLWEEAKAFCEWLTERERKAGKLGTDRVYRLPSDHEWSCAVGIGAQEDPSALPTAKNGLIDVLPWGTQWPPPAGAGNFAGEELKSPEWAAKFLNKTIDGYQDGFGDASPVGSFKPNAFGLFDLSGNVAEWCEDFSDPTHTKRVMRGGCSKDHVRRSLLSSNRVFWVQTSADGNSVVFGFRCVLAPSAP